jgi:hypothetical protein
VGKFKTEIFYICDFRGRKAGNEVETRWWAIETIEYTKLNLEGKCQGNTEV